MLFDKRIVNNGSKFCLWINFLYFRGLVDDFVASFMYIPPSFNPFYIHAERHLSRDRKRYVQLKLFTVICKFPFFKFFSTQTVNRLKNQFLPLPFALANFFINKRDTIYECDCRNGEGGRKKRFYIACDNLRLVFIYTGLVSINAVYSKIALNRSSSNVTGSKNWFKDNRVFLYRVGKLQCAQIPEKDYVHLLTLYIF